MNIYYHNNDAWVAAQLLCKYQPSKTLASLTRVPAWDDERPQGCSLKRVSGPWGEAIVLTDDLGPSGRCIRVHGLRAMYVRGELVNAIRDIGQFEVQRPAAEGWLAEFTRQAREYAHSHCVMRPTWVGTLLEQAFEAGRADHSRWMKEIYDQIPPERRAELAQAELRLNATIKSIERGE
jgi:hypothetical protein